MPEWMPFVKLGPFMLGAVDLLSPSANLKRSACASISLSNQRIQSLRCIEHQTLFQHLPKPSGTYARVLSSRREALPRYFLTGNLPSRTTPTNFALSLRHQTKCLGFLAAHRLQRPPRRATHPKTLKSRRASYRGTVYQTFSSHRPTTS